MFKILCNKNSSIFQVCKITGNNNSLIYISYRQILLKPIIILFMSVEHQRVNIDQKTKLIKNDIENLKKKFDKECEECQKYYKALQKSAQYIDICSKQQISVKQIESSTKLILKINEHMIKLVQPYDQHLINSKNILKQINKTLEQITDNQCLPLTQQVIQFYEIANNCEQKILDLTKF